MAEELSYVLVNPYTLRKSRTGGILARLMSRTALDLVAARLFAPSAKLVQEYAKALSSSVTGSDHSHKNRVRRLIQEYVLKNYSPDPVSGRRHRVMLWVFKGKDAVAKVKECVGDVSHRSVTGESIRDTYGDYIQNESGEVTYFEPAVFAATSRADAKKHLKIWVKYSDADGGLLKNVFPLHPTRKTERALVIIKPDNFTFPSGKPGNVLDMFSKTGLFIMAFKVHQMSVHQAEQFYGPVRNILREKFKETTGQKASHLLTKEFGLPIDPSFEKQIGNMLGNHVGDIQFNSIVRFMTGRDPKVTSASDRHKPGTVKSIVIVYEGENAVAKVRGVLGPTDPSKAPPGSIRREFGSSIMVNAAHASDSPANAKREMKILNVTENNFKTIVEEFYSPSRRRN